MINEMEKTYDLTMSRLIPGTPDEVFDAYTDAEKQKVWFSILEEEPGIVEIETDLRVGGETTAVWGPNQNELFRETQVFRIIDRPNRLVTTSSGSSPDGRTMQTEIDITFEDHDGGTLMTVVQTGFASEEMRDFFSTYAWVGAFDRIIAYVESVH